MEEIGPSATKICKQCLEVKPISDFYQNARYKGGYKHQCKRCHYVLPENTEDRKRIALRSHLWRKYELPLERYEEMLKEQNNACAICGDTNSKNKRWDRLVVDHCHKTGKVRALLCSHCNAGLGSFRDNPETLRKAIAYICEHV